MGSLPGLAGDGMSWLSGGTYISFSLTKVHLPPPTPPPHPHKGAHTPTNHTNAWHWTSVVLLDGYSVINRPLYPPPPQGKLLAQIAFTALGWHTSTEVNAACNPVHSGAASSINAGLAACFLAHHVPQYSRLF